MKPSCIFTTIVCLDSLNGKPIKADRLLRKSAVLALLLLLMARDTHFARNIVNGIHYVIVLT